MTEPVRRYVEVLTDPVTGETVELHGATEAELDRHAEQIFGDGTAGGESR